MAKITVAAACVMGLSYATEWFMAWYSGERAERSYLAYALGGHYAWLYLLMLTGNVFLPQVLWFKRARASLPVLITVSVGVLLGMWFERILIILNTLGHGYLPTLWRVFWPTVWDFVVLFGSVGLFAVMFLGLRAHHPLHLDVRGERAGHAGAGAMSRALLAAFPAPEPLRRAVDAARDAGAPALEAFTPYPIEGLSDALGQRRTNVPWWMLAGGVGVAALMYLTEWYSATRAYPFNQGGRPFNSWPAFMLAPVEIGVLAAAVTGFIVFLLKGGLPRLSHPLFEHVAFERASQDQFLLAVPAPGPGAEHVAARERLFDAGAVWVEEVEL